MGPAVEGHGRPPRGGAAAGGRVVCPAPWHHGHRPAGSDPRGQRRAAGSTAVAHPRASARLRDCRRPVLLSRVPHRTPSVTLGPTGHRPARRAGLQSQDSAAGPAGTALRQRSGPPPAGLPRAVRPRLCHRRAVAPAADRADLQPLVGRDGTGHLAPPAGAANRPLARAAAARRPPRAAGRHAAARAARARRLHGRRSAGSHVVPHGRCHGRIRAGLDGGSPRRGRLAPLVRSERAGAARPVGVLDRARPGPRQCGRRQPLSAARSPRTDGPAAPGLSQCLG